MPEVTCVRCSSTATWDEKIPPDGWRRTADGWICVEHGVDVGALFSELEGICARLEREHLTLSLDGHVELYERGVALQLEIADALRSAERQLVEVVGQDGAITKMT